MSIMKHVLVATLATLTIACGDDDGPSGPGQPAYTYEFAVSGAVTRTLKGPAYFGPSTNEEGQPLFGLVFGQDTSTHLVMLVKPGTARPAVGTYPIGEVTTGDGWAGLYIMSQGDEILELYIAEQGTITVTESTETRVRGTIQVTATLLFGGDEEETIVISGPFSAQRAPAAGAAMNRVRDDLLR